MLKLYTLENFQHPTYFTYQEIFLFEGYNIYLLVTNFFVVSKVSLLKSKHYVK